MTLTEHDVIDRLREAIRVAGSQRAFGRQHGISTQYINDVLRERREPGQKILDAIGVEKVVRYQPKEYREKSTPKSTPDPVSDNEKDAPFEAS